MHMPVLCLRTENELYRLRTQATADLEFEKNSESPNQEKIVSIQQFIISIDELLNLSDIEKIQLFKEKHIIPEITW